MMKTVGIIGGVGSETTADFYMEIISGCQKIDHSARPLVLISSIPIPYQIEKYAILHNEKLEAVLPYLVNEAKRLEKAGADFIVLPCNSLHLFVNEIRKEIQIPLLSIIEETVKYLSIEKINRIGILSTSVTNKHQLYDDELNKANIKFDRLSDTDQQEVDQIIYRIVKGKFTQVDETMLSACMNRYSDCGSILLACTDLQILVENQHKMKVYDTMKILAESTCEYICS